jgi:hypothetical protein
MSRELHRKPRRTSKVAAALRAKGHRISHEGVAGVLRAGPDPCGLPELLEFIRKLNNEVVAYVDKRSDEQNDAMNLLLRHLDERQRETDSLSRRLEALERDRNVVGRRRRKILHRPGPG